MKRNHTATGPDRRRGVSKRVGLGLLILVMAAGGKMAVHSSPARQEPPHGVSPGSPVPGATAPGALRAPERADEPGSATSEPPVDLPIAVERVYGRLAVRLIEREFPLDGANGSKADRPNRRS